MGGSNVAPVPSLTSHGTTFLFFLLWKLAPTERGKGLGYNLRPKIIWTQSKRVQKDFLELTDHHSIISGIFSHILIPDVIMMA